MNEPRTERSFTQYVHEYETEFGTTRYAVGRWDPERAQFTRPFDATEAKITGCFAEFARKASAVQSYESRRRALRRARYLFYEMDRDYDDFLDECAEKGV